jgi:hypothetical protein
MTGYDEVLTRKDRAAADELVSTRTRLSLARFAARHDDDHLYVRRIRARQRAGPASISSRRGRGPCTRQIYGATFGGPVKVPGIYDGNRRTSFTLAYNGNRSSNAFDQYATVPTPAMRAGDYSASPVRLIDP